MKKSLYLVCLLFFVSQLSAQSQEPLVELENEKITADEFLFRFEMTPRVNNLEDTETLKEQFLITLIAEKLWAKEARNLGYEDDRYLNNYLKIIEKLYVRDALFKREIESKAKAAEEELNEAVMKYGYDLGVKFLFSPSKDEIDSLYKALLAGADFDSLLSVRPERREQQEAIKVSFGQMEEDKEAILFGLDVHEFSKPVKEKTGWVIYYIEGKTVPTGEDVNVYRDVRNVIENRRKAKLFDVFVKQVYDDKKINVDNELFASAASKISDAVKDKFEEDVEEVVLYEQEIRKIKSAFSHQELAEPFVKFPEDPITLNYFLDDMEFNGFHVTTSGKDEIPRLLHSYIREFILLELLAREGYERDLHTDPEIKEQLSLWRDNYLAQVLRNSYTDSAKVTDNEAYNYFLEEKGELGKIKKVNIIELLTDSLEVIEAAFGKINDTERFRKFVLANTNREWVRENNGEFGLFGVNEYGEIGKTADGMAIGESYGPLKLEEGYSLFKIIDIVEEERDSTKISFEERKDIITQKMFYDNLEKTLTEKTIEFAKKYNLRINTRLLKSLEVSNINMVVYRHFGFGGRILAAPFLNRFYKWFNEYKNGKDIVF